MIISFPNKIATLVLIILNLSFITVTYAQTGSGNIIKEISLQSKNNQTYLVIQGLLSPDTLSKIGLKKSGKKFVISLPNSIVDPESMQNPFLSYRPGELLENIRIVEKPLETDTGVSYGVDLVVQGRIEMTPYKVEPITSSTLRFLLKKEELGSVQSKETKKESDVTANSTKMKEEPTGVQSKETKKGLDVAGSSTESSAKNQQSVTVSAPLEVKEIIQRYRKPSLLQVAILNASGYSRRAYKLSVFLGKIKKRQIEEELGIKLDIVNIADAKSDKYPQSTIYFRDNFLKSALYLAELISGEQKIVPLQNQKEKIGVDIEIFLGKDYK